MARPMKFDREEKLNLAMELFWQKGYQATSMKNIVDTLGLQPGSIYSAFKNKKALFIETIEHYFCARITVFRQLFEQTDSPTAAFQQILSDLIQDTLDDDKGKGCLMVNTLLEMGPHDDEIRSKVKEMFTMIEAVFAEGFSLAQKKGELDQQSDPYLQAKLLMIQVQGLRVYAYMRSDAKTLEDILRELISCLKLRPLNTELDS